MHRPSWRALDLTTASNSRVECRRALSAEGWALRLAGADAGHRSCDSHRRDSPSRYTAGSHGSHPHRIWDRRATGGTTVKHSVNSPQDSLPTKKHERKQALSVKRAGLYQGAPRRLQRREEAQLRRDRRAPDWSQELRPPARQAFLGYRQVRSPFLLIRSPADRVFRTPGSPMSPVPACPSAFSPMPPTSTVPSRSTLSTCPLMT